MQLGGIVILALMQSACVALGAHSVETRSPTVRLSHRTESRLVESSRLQIVDADYRSDTKVFSARLVNASTCDVEHFERSTETVTRSTEYSGSPWVMIGAEGALAGATLFEAGICESGSASCTGIQPQDRQSVGTLFLATGSAVALAALVDLAYIAVRGGSSSEKREDEKLAYTAREPCKSDAVPIRDKVGVIAYNGYARHFMTDSYGRFVIEEARSPYFAKVYVEINEETAWIDLMARR